MVSPSAPKMPITVANSGLPFGPSALLETYTVQVRSDCNLTRAYRPGPLCPAHPE